MQYDALILAIVMVVFLFVWYRRARKKTQFNRMIMYNDCLHLFDEEPVISQDDLNYPSLEGKYRGYRISLKPISDQVVFRQIPSLWLSVTVHEKIPYKGVSDFLVRPQNTEFYSPWINLKESIPIPLNWPQHAVFRSDDPDKMPPVEVLDHFMGVFEDPKFKELLVTERGVRIVYQIDQMQRSQYLVLRQPYFENFHPNHTLLSQLLDLVCDATDALKLSPQEKMDAAQL